MLVEAAAHSFNALERAGWEGCDFKGIEYEDLGGIEGDACADPLCKSEGSELLARPKRCCTAGRRWRVSEVPFSSLRAVVAKSTGVAFDQVLSVTAGSSGEPKTMASTMVKMATTRSAMTPSLTMS